MEYEFEHFIYAPTPKKGYSIRAQSSNVNTYEYKEIASGYFVPINPAALKDYSHEARVIIASPSSETIYFSRIFRRAKLDERGRSGIVSHIISVPRNLLQKNLSYTVLENAAINFEKEHGIPIGEMPPLKVEWDEYADDEDIKKTSNYISKDSLNKIIETFRKTNAAKVFVLFKKSSFRDRINLAYSLSKILDIKLGFKGLKIMTEPPLSLILDIFPNILISNVMLPLKPNRGWIVIKPFPESKEVYVSAEEKKINELMKELYDE